MVVKNWCVLCEKWHADRPCPLTLTTHLNDLTGAPARLLFGRWYIVKRDDQEFAWTGSEWSFHVGGLPHGNVQLCNFATEGEARRYVAEVPPDVTAYEARRVHERRGLRWLLCAVGIHKMLPVYELRPWVVTNSAAAWTDECARCGRLESNA